MRLSNFMLMLKQGIKGVFKFKIQFFIIVLLAFVSTFILSIALSTQNRLKDSYDEIVKPIDKFAFSGTTRVGSTVDVTNDPLLLPNLVNNSGTGSLTVIDKDGTTVKNGGSYNYVLNNFDGKYKDQDGKVYNSFITKGTKEFINYVKDNNLSKAQFMIADNKDSGAAHLLDFYLKNLYLELNAISSEKIKGISLSKISSVDNAEISGSQTIYSPIGLFTYNHPYWFKDMVKVENDDVTFNFDVAGNKNVDVYRTVFYAVAHLVDLQSQMITTFNTESAFIDNSATTQTQLDGGTCPLPTYKIQTNDQAIAFLYGEKISNDVKLPTTNDWIVDDNYSNLYSINATLDMRAEDTSSNLVFASPLEANGGRLNDSIWYSGLRGITNPIINNLKTLDAAKQIGYTNLVNWNWYAEIDYSRDITDNDKTLFYILDFKRYNPYSENIDSNAMYTIANGTPGPFQGIAHEYQFATYITYNKIVSGAAGFKYGVREETTNFDSLSQISFRSILLEDVNKTKYEDYNFKILEGSWPSDNQIAINEQFAKKHHIKLLDKIKTVNGIVTVSAIASDAFSYVPGQDLIVPIPNAESSAIIWGSRDTLNKLNDETATGGATPVSQIVYNLCYFLWDELKDDSNINVRKNAWYALFSNSRKHLLDNYAAVKEYVNSGTISSSPASSNISLKAFNNSPFQYSWTVLPMVLTVYDSVVYIASAVIALIAIIALIVSVKKTVDFNSKQIGILKALGEKSGAVSVSYISQPLIIGFIVVPIAWIIGIVCQLALASLFGNWFTLIPNTISFDWISLVISFGVLGIISCLVSFTAAFVLNKRPILQILVSSVKWGRLRFVEWFKGKMLKRAPFNVRFSLTLTSSGSKQITLMTVVMFIASLLIGISIAIPAIVVKINSSYYAAIKYSNKYNQVPLIGNQPLSKSAVSYWDGQEYADSQFVAKDPIVKDGYYKDQSAYYATVNNSSIFSQYIYDDNDKKIYDSYSYVLKNLKNMIPLVTYYVGNNMYTTQGVGLSAGSIDALYGVLVHSLDPIDSNDGNINLNKLTLDSGKYTDDNRRAFVEGLSQSLTDQLPNILSTIMSKAAKQDVTMTGNTWKEKILSVIFSILPSYVKNYVQKSPSRQDQYAMSFQNEIYIPTQETLATLITNDNQSVRNKTQSVTLTGLDKNQNSIIISDKSRSSAYLSDDIKKQIYNIINVPVNNPGVVNNDIIDKKNNLKIYDGKTHTLYIPTIANNQAISAYNFSEGKTLSNWENNLGLFQLNMNGTMVDLPSDAWIYDDTDYVNYYKKNNSSSEISAPYANSASEYDRNDPNKYWIWSTNEDQNRYYLDASKIDNGKWTYAQEFNNDDSLYDKALMFKEFRFNGSDVPNGTFIRPMYQYKNVKLMIPMAWIGNDEDSILYNDGLQYTKFGKDTKNWHEQIDYKDVPLNVQDSYRRLTLNGNNNHLDWNDVSQPNSKWLVLNPYDTAYFDGNHYVGTPINHITDGTPYWFKFVRMGATKFNVATNTDLKDYLLSQGASPKLKIDLKSVGSINSYNDKLLVIDQDLANLLAGYKNTRAYQYNYQIFDTTKGVKAGKKGDTSVLGENAGLVSAYDRWKLKDTSDPNFILSDWTNKQNGAKLEKEDLWSPHYWKIDKNKSILDYAPHSYFNTKFSNIDEPLDISSQISFTTIMRLGQMSVGAGKNDYASDGYNISVIQSQELLSTVRALTSQVTGVAIAIGSMLTAAIIITAALLTMLTGDIYISQYKRFMILLRALGYSNGKITLYTFGTVTVFAMAAWILGTVIAWLGIFAAVEIMWNAGFAVPVGINWWPVLLSLLILAASYVGSLYVSSMKARKLNPSEVLTETAE